MTVSYQEQTPPSSQVPRLAWRGGSRQDHTVRTRIIGLHARALELPLLVRSGSLLLLFCLELGQRGQLSLCTSPLSKRENFGRRSLGPNCSGSYGTHVRESPLSGHRPQRLFRVGACLSKMGPFRWAAVSAVKMVVSPFRKGRETAICMGERNRAVVSKQALEGG